MAQAKKKSLSALVEEFDLDNEIKFNIRSKNGLFGEFVCPRRNRNSNETFSARLYKSANLWFELKSQEMVIHDWLKKRRFERQVLLEKKVLIGLSNVSTSDDEEEKIYVCLHTISDKSGELVPSRSMNIPISSWYCLMEQQGPIEYYMPSVTRKRKSEDDEHKKIKLFRYSLEKFESNETIEGEWKKTSKKDFMQEVLKLSAQGKAAVIQQNIAVPSTKDLIRFVLVFALRCKLLEGILEESCHACSLEMESSEHHTCKQPFQERVASCYDIALKQIIPYEIRTYMNKLCRFLEIDSIKQFTMLQKEIEKEDLKDNIISPSQEQEIVNEILKV
ncbi:unnamed protein product [Owenia fusiformis]|uniref:Uncharacterized protein n=1 Tax=Owenia fusiformis TaxID=6347 RepID=A0A8J1UZT9_OWEFU|nr:unnamed protein product [Owenia fusiformis]